MNSLELVSQKSSEQTTRTRRNIAFMLGWAGTDEEYRKQVYDLRQWTYENRVDRNDLAIVLGCKPERINKWFAGKALPRLSVWKSIRAFARCHANGPQRITKVILLLSALFSVMTLGVNADIPKEAHINDAFKHSIKRPIHNHILEDTFQVIARKY